MAAKRVSKSVVDWAAFAERVPKLQKDTFRSFKARSDHFIASVHKHPENASQIDWAFYKSRIAVPGMVEKFEQAYQALNVPYPTDKANKKAEVEKDEKEAQVASAKYVEESRQSVQGARDFLKALDSLPPLEDITHEMYSVYFPDLARNPIDRPTVWPHVKSYQPGYDPSREVK